jgi:hypothetical protein
MNYWERRRPAKGSGFYTGPVAARKEACQALCGGQP